MKLRRDAVFQLPALPPGQSVMDLFHFQIGKRLFLFVTALNMSERSQPALNRLFRMSGEEPWVVDPEPILSVPGFHPRNLAVGPEIQGSRWIWIADHGSDFPPFPGGCSSLYRVHEDGKVEPFDPPLLRERRFSFDGAIWANPESGDHWLYQSNIGSAPHPVWMKWDKHRNVTDLSAGLPQELHLGKRKFLVSRAVFPGEREMSLFMGVDTSGGGSDVLESDLILTLREDGTAGFDPDIRLPARLLDPTWSTVELAAEDYDGDGRIDLLLLYHDRDFREGIAEILWSTGKGSRLKRNSARLPIPPLAGEETWIARAASGDLFRDNRIHIALYLRPSRADTSRNLIFLRNRGERKFEDVTSLIGLGGERFVGGFFAGADRSHWIQLTYGGLVEAFRFELS